MQYVIIGIIFYSSQTVVLGTVVIGSLSPRHGGSSGCGWRNGLQYGG